MGSAQVLRLKRRAGGRDRADSAPVSLGGISGRTRTRSASTFSDMGGSVVPSLAGRSVAGRSTVTRTSTHLLGRTSLRTERDQRAAVESQLNTVQRAAVQQTKELFPMVEDLQLQVAQLQSAGMEQLDLEAESQLTFSHLQQQLEGLRSRTETALVSSERTRDGMHAAFKDDTLQAHSVAKRERGKLRAALLATESRLVHHREAGVSDKRQREERAAELEAQLAAAKATLGALGDRLTRENLELREKASHVPRRRCTPPHAARHCHAAATPLPRRCHAAATPLPRRCHAAATPLTRRASCGLCED